MNRESLYFTAPEEVRVCEEAAPLPQRGEVQVRTLMSAISPGTEMLAYRGSIPQEMVLDASISALGGSFRYPFKYGYSCVGEVSELGEGVGGEWLGRRVFAFNPHESLFSAAVEDLHPLPDGVSLEDALFLPNMETAVNFVHDGHPLAGEVVVVFGLGIVGLLTTALLKRFPLGALAVFDRFSLRREAAQMEGVTACFDPSAEGARQQALDILYSGGQVDGADLVFELSGSPVALNQAIQISGFAGRVIVGSWYAGKDVHLDLGGAFHRSRIRLISSQVSTISPELSARWSKPRRLNTAWENLRVVQPARWITHRFPFAQAAQAYRLLAEAPQETIQVVLDYRGG